MIIDELITDRTEADRARVLALAAIAWEDMTETQRAAWESSLRGAYNAADANRVGAAVNYLAGLLNGLQAALDAYRAAGGVASDGIFNVTWGQVAAEGKTDWTDADEPSPEQLAAYLASVSAAVAALPVAAELPGSMADLTIAGANAIELALRQEHAAALDFELNKRALISRAAQSWHYAGTINSGEG